MARHNGRILPNVGQKKKKEEIIEETADPMVLWTRYIHITHFERCRLGAEYQDSQSTAYNDIEEQGSCRSW